MRVACAAGAFVTLSLLAGCGAGGDDGTESGRTLDVLAASSLTEGFGTLAHTFEQDHPGVDVRLVLESSTTLATQVTEGAPADVLATADEDSMQTVLDSGDADKADAFATNRIVLVTPADNPAGIRSFADLDDPDLAYVACVETAPCGSSAATLLEANDVTAEPRSLEVDVKAVLTKVTSGEADAGLVYASDARAAGKDVQAFPVPGAEEARNTYLIAVVGQADDPALAQDWVDLVTSSAGQQVLADAGFGPGDLTATP